MSAQFLPIRENRRAVEGLFPAGVIWMERETIVNFKIIELLKAPKGIRRLSRYAGLILFFGWLAYIAYVCVSGQVGWPDEGDQLDIASVAIVLFAVGWVSVRLGFHAINRMHSTILPERRPPEVD
jgi:hypothetical protein